MAAAAHRIARRRGSHPPLAWGFVGATNYHRTRVLPPAFGLLLSLLQPLLRFTQELGCLRRVFGGLLRRAWQFILLQEFEGSVTGCFVRPSERGGLAFRQGEVVLAEAAFDDLN